MAFVVEQGVEGVGQGVISPLGRGQQVPGRRSGWEVSGQGAISPR